MSRTARDRYLHPYRQAYESHGHGFGVTLWASHASQQQRFAVFAGLVDFTGRRVLDAGCSRGDFAAYLIERGQRYAQFIGVDGIEAVIDHAGQRGLPRAAFYCRDFVTEPSTLAIGAPEIVAISGALNTMDKRTALAVLDAAWAAAGRTLVFNFLSDQAGPGAIPQRPPTRRLPTLDLLQWAFARTPAVQFRQDYFDHGHDATIAMEKTTGNRS